MFRNFPQRSFKRRPEPFRKSQKKCLRMILTILNADCGPENFGKMIFIQLLQNEEFAKSFKFSSGTLDADMYRMEFAERHGQRFMWVICDVINNLDRVQNCEQLLINLGDIHRKLDGFEYSQIDLTCEACKKIWSEMFGAHKAVKQHEADDAWMALFEFVKGTMQKLPSPVVESPRGALLAVPGMIHEQQLEDLTMKRKLSH